MDTLQQDKTNQYTSLGGFFIVNLILQLIINVSVVMNICKDSGSNNLIKNLLSAAFFTFFPWAFIFGTIVLILIIYPGFKSGFSDVVGYFFIYDAANNILNQLIDVNKKTEDGERSASADTIVASEAVQKIYGNTGILINKIVPDNFVYVWNNILEPLFSDNIKRDSKKLNELKEQLLQVAIKRDNIGEAMWFLYTGIIVISIVSYNISSKACANDPASMQKKYKQYLDEEQAKIEQKAKQEGTEYTLK
jgi:hypothetical protein